MMQLDDPSLVYTHPTAKAFILRQAPNYPVLKWVEKGGYQDFRPALVKEMLPKIDFLRVAFPYQTPACVCWAFRTHEDMTEVFGEGG